MAKSPKKPAPSKQQQKKMFVGFMADSFQNFSSDLKAEIDANFQYTFEITGEVEIHRLDINMTVVKEIKTQDKIWAARDKPFYIGIQAVRTSGDGSATFQLFDLVKKVNVFSEPQQLVFGPGGQCGFFLEDVKLP